MTVSPRRAGRSRTLGFPRGTTLPRRRRHELQRRYRAAPLSANARPTANRAPTNEATCIAVASASKKRARRTYMRCSPAQGSRSRCRAGAIGGPLARRGGTCAWRLVPGAAQPALVWSTAFARTRPAWSTTGPAEVRARVAARAAALAGFFACHPTPHSGRRSSTHDVRSESTSFVPSFTHTAKRLPVPPQGSDTTAPAGVQVAPTTMPPAASSLTPRAARTVRRASRDTRSPAAGAPDRA